MAKQTTPLAATIDEFNEARGDRMDGVWAHSVAWRLLRRDVEPAQVNEGLADSLAVVRDAQESPQSLFGTPEEHADALYDQWADEGRLHLWDASRMTWAEVPSWGLGMGALWCLGFLVVFLAQGETTRAWTLGMAFIPVGIGVVKAMGWATWDTLLRSRGPVVAAAGTTGVLGTSALVLALVNEWSKGHALGTASTWWYVWIAMACGLLAAALGRWVESRPPTEPDGFATIDAWSRELAAILRGRHHLAEAQVRSIIGDAQAHAAESGRSMEEEFGTPEEYAAGFTPDRARRHRFEAGLWALMGAIQASWLLDGFSWWRTGVAVACLVVAWRSYRRVD